MRTAFTLSAALFCGVVTAVQAQSSAQATQPSAEAVADNEENVVGLLHQAARGHDAATVSRLLGHPKKQGIRASDSILMLQRAVSVCATLQNENDYSGAVAVAQLALAQVQGPHETKDTDNAAVLLLQTWLTSQVLGDKVAALQLAKKALTFSPGNAEAARQVAELSDAVATFGR